MPGELVNGLRGKIQSISFEVPLDRCDQTIETGSNPDVRGHEFTVTGFQLLGIHQHVARGVPQLVAEIPVALDTTEVETNVSSGCRQGCEGEA